MILFRLHNITLLEAVKHWNIFWSHSSRLVNVKFKVKRAILKRTWLHSAKIQKNLCATFVLLLRFWDRFSRSESSWEDCDYRPKYVWSPGFVCWYFEVIKSTTEWLKKKKKRSPEKSWGHSRLRCCSRTLRVMSCNVVKSQNSFTVTLETDSHTENNTSLIPSIIPFVTQT